MPLFVRLRALTLSLLAVLAPLAVDAQTAPAAGANPTSVCGLPIGPPAALPPAGSGPVVFLIAPCFAKQGGTPLVEPETYLFYIQLRPSLPSQNQWVPWDETTVRTASDDFKRLWGTNFLSDLSVEVTDYVFANGVVGKMFNCLNDWREVASDVRGCALPCGHFLPEEQPELTLTEVRKFLIQHPMKP